MKEEAMKEFLEIEQKFDVDEGFALPDFSGVPGCARQRGPLEHQLEATYFDTPDLRLAASKITLRRRSGGTDEGWHLKAPAGAGARREVHAPLSASPREVVPAELASLVAAVAGGLPLAPIAVLRTRRSVTTLVSASGQVLAEIADDVVDARREPAGASAMRWREVEVEVPEPAPQLQQEAARLLLAAGARPSGEASKLARLLEG